MTDLTMPNAFENRRDLVGYDPLQEVVESGTCSLASTTTIDSVLHGVFSDPVRSWLANQWSTVDVVITPGLGDAQTLTILSNNPTDFTASVLDPAWTVDRSVSDAVTTASSTTLTSATAAFDDTDTGALISGDGIPEGTTIVSVTSPTEVELSAEAFISSSDVIVAITTQYGYVITVASPGLNIAYLRYDVTDPTIARALSFTTMMVEPFDYQTVRLHLGVGSELNDRFLADIEAGLVPEVALVRSSYGTPKTPLDGETVWRVPYNDSYFFVEPDPLNAALPVAGSLRSRQMTLHPYDHTRDVPDFQREITHDPEPALYDRGLMNGRWYYYALFLYVSGPDPADTSNTIQHWTLAKTGQALVPNDYKHRQYLFQFLPVYYQALDIEYVAGTNQGQGYLQQLFNVIGFELDLVRTLSEGIENIYNIDQVNQSLVEMLGTSTLGLVLEDALGENRYRSLVSVINRLYAERGSALSIQQLCSIASKYTVEVSRGANLLRLGDDSQFYGGTGAWGAPPAELLDSTGLLGNVATPAVAQLTPTVVDINETSSKRASVCDLVATDTDGADGMVITCGYGVGAFEDRLHRQVPKEFVPYYHGVRCTPGLRYTFSFYLRADVDSVDDGTVAPGILWFLVPRDTLAALTALNVSLDDYISKDEPAVLPGMPSSTTTLTKYAIEAEAPDLTDPSIAPRAFNRLQYVFGVPYIAFSGVAGVRTISSCMFNLRSSAPVDLVPLTNLYLTLTEQGSSVETLGSEYVLGNPT